MSVAVGTARRRWVRAIEQRWLVLDAIAAAALTAGALAAVTTLRHDLTVPATVVAAVACTSAVAWRRVHPSVALALVLTAIVVYQISGQDSQGTFVTIAIVLVAYLAGRAEPSRIRLALLAGYGLTACAAIDADAGFSTSELVLTWAPLVLVPMAGGVFVARRAELIEQLRAMQGRLLGEQELRHAASVAEERCRVARELHDVVAHCVSVMVIQTGAARLHATADAPAARRALHTVADSGRDALIDLRRVVGVRRRADRPDLHELVARSREAGLDVHLEVDDAAPAPPEVERTVLRIVQESLTNVRKHASRAAVDVVVRIRLDAVDVVVEDTGPPDDASLVAGARHGLTGMRERVALHGGDFEAGPTPTGGFAVRACLPTAALTAPTASVHVEAARRRWWMRVSATHLDALLAVAWLVPLEIEAVTSTHRTGPVAVTALCVAGMALAAVLRRRAPLLFLAIVGAFAIALSGGVAAPERPSVVSVYTLFVGGYTVAAYCRLARACVGLAVLLTGVVAVAVVHDAAAGVAFGGALTASVAWVAGRVARQQRELTAQLRITTARLAVENETRASIARHDERVRIARDLNARVTRLVVDMVVQAEAAADQLPTDSAGAVEWMTAVERNGRQALGHMRDMLGVLRAVPS